ncbi:MAG: hypothetical protein PHV34_24115 [Verrucomicrobiae bacterium]|nr:hypothetical protein [Verrucomicrobiae bacterium]
MKKLWNRNESLATQIQTAIDVGKDVSETEPPTDRRKNARAYRKAVPLSHEEALQIALNALQAYYVEQPLFASSAADNISKAAIGKPLQKEFTWQKDYKESEPISLDEEGAEKEIEIELQTETQISKTEEETLPLKRMPKEVIDEQQAHIIYLRKLINFMEE